MYVTNLMTMAILALLALLSKVVSALDPSSSKLRPLFSRALRKSSSFSGGGRLPSGNSVRRVERLRMVDQTTADAAIQGISAAFVGGATGVMGVMFALELKKVTEDKNVEGCPYCMGNGEILCGICMGNGRCAMDGERCNPDGSCDLCDGRGLVQCINCKGDGRITPIILQSKAVRDPEFSPDNVSLDAP